MSTGYTRQVAADFVAGLVIKAADMNAEFNQVQSAFDNTTGHDHSGSASGVGAKISLTSSVTGTLPVANGGLGITSGTSGGILAFTGATTIASSALLTTSAILLGGGAGAVPTVLSSLGTTSTLLHGNASGAPTWAQVALTSEVTGILSVANGGAGWASTSITSNHTVVSGDNRVVLQCGGTAFYTIIFPDPSTLTNFSVYVSNIDSTRAKYITGTSITAFYLWPGQTALVFNQTGTWQILRQARWNLPSSIAVNYDPVNGSDTLGVTDGLGTGAAAFQSASHAIDMAMENFDWYSTGSVERVVTILGTAATTDTTNIHWACHGLVGGHGSSALVLDLNGGTHNATIQVYFGGVLRIRNGTLSCSSGAGAAVEAIDQGIIYLMDALTFGTLSSGGCHMLAHFGGEIRINNNYTISAGAAGSYHYQVGGNGIIFCAAASTITVSANVIFTSIIYGTNGYADLSNTSWSLGGHTVTATAFSLQNNTTLFEPTLTYYPNLSGVTQGTWDSWSSYTPTLTLGSGTFSVAPTVSGNYRTVGSTTEGQVSVTFSTIGTAGTSLRISIPTADGGVSDSVFIGGEVAVTGVALFGYLATGQSGFLVSDVAGNKTNFMVSGNKIVFSFAYQNVPH